MPLLKVKLVNANIAASIMTQITQSDNHWKLNGDVVIGTAKTILTDSEALAINNNTVIDFEQVEDIDTTAVSLILEWKRRAIKANQTLKFINLPINLTSLVQLYDVEDLI